MFHGVTVLQQRHLECYVWDDEIIAKLCVSQGRGDAIVAALEIRKDAISASIGRGRPLDDVNPRPLRCALL